MGASTLEGKITSFTNNKCGAVVKTELGDAYIDCNTENDIRLKIGDKIHVDDAEFYILHGKIFTILEGKIWLNDVLVDCG